MIFNKKKYISTHLKIPEAVQIEKKNNFLVFSGPLGKSKLNLKRIDSSGEAAISILSNDQKINIITLSKSLNGLIKTLITNKIQGVSRGFLIYLKIVGIGYRVTLDANKLILKLGYSHDILYKLPNSVKAFLLDPSLFCLFGIDKNQITQIAAKIRDLRKPSVYKGKGIRFLNEQIVLKTGKRK